MTQHTCCVGSNYRRISETRLSFPSEVLGVQIVFTQMMCFLCDSKGLDITGARSSLSVHDLHLVTLNSNHDPLQMNVGPLDLSETAFRGRKTDTRSPDQFSLNS